MLAPTLNGSGDARAFQVPPKQPCLMAPAPQSSATPLNPVHYGLPALRAGLRAQSSWPPALPRWQQDPSEPSLAGLKGNWNVWAAGIHRAQTPIQDKASLATHKTIHVPGHTKEPSPGSLRLLIKPCKDPGSFHTSHPTNPWLCPPQLPAGSHVETGKFPTFPSLYFIQLTTFFWEGFYSIS